MTRNNSAKIVRAARFAAAACVLLTLAMLAHRATAAPQPPPDTDFAISLEQSATAVPLGGTMGFTGVIRFPADASSVQARLQVRRPGGRLVYQRTQYVASTTDATQTYAFGRPLEGLGLEAGTYPVTFSIRATIKGSQVATEVTQPMRVYDPSKPQVPVVVLVKVHARPLTGPNSSFAIDPAGPEAARSRTQVDGVTSLVLGDPAARLTLAISPVTIEEWRRFSTRGYTMASGTVVPAGDPTSLAYAATLERLKLALATGRLELLTMGYSDPNLSDLAANKLLGDAGTQYDAGLSAVFASLETTPSSGTAPAGGCIPAAMQRHLIARNVGYTFAEADSTRIAKRTGVATGVYPSADSTLAAIVLDARASRGMESGDASATLARTFERVGTSAANQAVAVRIDLDETATDATSTVGYALATLEGTPWVRLELGREAHAPKGAKSVTFAPTATKNAPAGFWARVRSARANATGMIAVLTSSDGDATSAEVNSLVAESSAWTEPAATWVSAKDGLAFADAALKTSKSVFGAIKVSATSVTLAGATGDVPVTIQNTSKKTLNVMVVTKTTGGMVVAGSRAVPTKLAPRETYVTVPVDMQSTLYGKLTVQVMAGSVVISKQTVTVRRSYLDRLALIGGIVVVLGGMLVWIVMRVRRAPGLDDDGTDSQPSGAEHDDASARYTEARSDGPRDRDQE
jgi:hypothetical protein